MSQTFDLHDADQNLLREGMDALQSKGRHTLTRFHPSGKEVESEPTSVHQMLPAPAENGQAISIGVHVDQGAVRDKNRTERSVKREASHVAQYQFYLGSPIAQPSPGALEHGRSHVDTSHFQTRIHELSQQAP